MSVQLHITAEREATVNVRGNQKTIIDKIQFELFPTSTEFTYDVLNLKSIETQINVYCDLVKSLALPMVTFEDYEDSLDTDLDFILDDKSYSDNHIEHLRSWVNMCDEEGYTIKFIMV